jgi:hypothetical protein
MQLKGISKNHLLNVVAILIVLIAGYVVIKLFRQNAEIETFIENAVAAKNVAPITTTTKPITAVKPVTTSKPLTTAKQITAVKPVTTSKPLTTPKQITVGKTTTTKQPVKLVTTSFAPTSAPTKLKTTAASSVTTITPIQDQINALNAKISTLQSNCATKADTANNLVKGVEYTQKINGKASATKLSLS